MAHIYLAYHQNDAVLAEGLAQTFRFLDFNVALCSNETTNGQDLVVGTHGEADVLLVLWTPESRRDPWVLSQCRNLKDPNQMVVVMSKASASHALPLMIHESCVVWLDDGNGRVSPMHLATIFAEVGERLGRGDVGQFVYALTQKRDAERHHALSVWLDANPDDALSNPIRAAISNESTGNIHAAFNGFTRQLTKPAKGVSKMAGGLTFGFLNAETTKKVAIAAAGVISVGTLSLILNNFLADRTLAEASDIAAMTAQPASVTQSVASGTISDPEFTRSDRVAEIISPPTNLAETTALLPDTELIADTRDVASLAPSPTVENLPYESSEDESAEVPSELPYEELVSEFPEYPDATPEVASYEADPVEALIETLDAEPIDEALLEVVEETTELNLDPGRDEAELLLPYIAGEQGPGDAFTDRLADGSGAPQMVIIQTGTFKMGSPLTERGRDPGEGPQRSISIFQPIAVGKYEVTVAEFTKFVEATGYDAGDACKTYTQDRWSVQSGRNYRNPGYRQSNSHPATCVSWPAAIAYTEWLSEQTGETYRLLSEAEWEYVARAGSEQAFPFGNDANAGCAFMNASDFALTCKDGAEFAARVGSFSANNFGLHDMHGNVWEWTADAWNSSISGVSSSGSARESGETFERVVRGGSFFTLDFWLRSASRNKFSPEDRMYDVGFRIARDL